MRVTRKREGEVMFDLQVSMSIIWTVLIIVFTLIEGFSLGLTSIWFAVGSLAALIASAFHVPVLVQILIFAIVATLTIVYARPITIRYLKVGETKTNAMSLVGKKGYVVKVITPEATGQVKVSGQIWTARADDESHLDPETPVKVLGIEGVKLIVHAIEKED